MWIVDFGLCFVFFAWLFLLLLEVFVSGNKCNDGLFVRLFFLLFGGKTDFVTDAVKDSGDGFDLRFGTVFLLFVSHFFGNGDFFVLREVNEDIEGVRCGFDIDNLLPLFHFFVIFCNPFGQVFNRHTCFNGTEFNVHVGFDDSGFEFFFIDVVRNMFFLLLRIRCRDFFLFFLCAHANLW